MDRKTHDIFKEVKKLSDDINELKSPQYSGSSNTTTYMSRTGAMWDIDFTFPGTSGRNYLVKFTADTQVAPFASIGLVALINNTVEYKVARMSNAKIYTYVNPFNAQSQNVAPNEMEWVVVVQAYAGGTNVKIRAEVYGTDTGTVEVSLL